ncbi:hypothetical protein JW930_04705 [Candidatus Woesearchaeota archaeon]|nr:hypothetical protein [Candidatus Woesearchaeota archaeon]
MTETTQTATLTQRMPNSLGVLLAVLAIAQYILDITWWMFDGFDYRVIFSKGFFLILVNFIMPILIWVVALGTIVLHRDKRTLLCDILTGVAVGILMLLGAFHDPASFGHMFFIIIYFILLRNYAEDKVEFRYAFLLLLLFDYFGFGLFSSFLNFGLSGSLKAVFWSRAFIPIWTLWVLYSCSRLTGRPLFAILLSIIFAIYIIVLVGDNIPNVYSGHASRLSRNTVRQVLNMGWNAIKLLFWEGPKSVITGTGQWFNRQISEATGYDYYTSQVEENKDEPLGVYLDDVETMDPVYHQGDSVTIRGFIKARTLEDKEIPITISCYYEDNEKIKHFADEVSPSTQLQLRDFNEKFVTCEFDNLAEGTYDIIMHVEFDFRTLSYVRTYFMDSNSLLAKRKELMDNGQDYSNSGILSSFNLKQPLTVYTNGPIELELGSNEPPINVGQDESIYYSVKISNLWRGQIKSINDLYMLVPEPLWLRGSGTESRPGEFSCGNDQFKKISSSGEGEEGFNKFGMVGAGSPEKVQDIEWDEIEFACFMEVPKSYGGVETLEETEAPTAKTLKATVEYTYSIEKKVYVDVLQALS